MVGLFVMSNNSGIGIQSKRLCYLFKPDRILAIDSTPFAKNKKQHWEWYDNFKGYKVQGFPKNNEIDVFLKGLTKVFCIENPFNFHLLDECKKKGIKLYIQSNWEFSDHLNRDLTLPTKFLMPSYWKVEEMKARFGDDKVMYLPPPIDPQEFAKARNINLVKSGKRKFLHIVGTLATYDRNGTLSLLDAVKKSKGDYTMVIRSQAELPQGYQISDARVEYVVDDTDDLTKMYEGYDAMIIPRRYGGLCLPMIEALISGLPVIMPDISPNNQILPKKWLVPAKITGLFQARTPIDVYSVDIDKLAEKLDEMSEINCEKEKTEAFDIGYNNYSETVLLPKYQKL